MIHEYHCSVCLGCFGTRKEWLSHLLESNHQTKARKELSRWGQPERECVLVVFTTFPIASFDLLQFFSKGSSNLVTDFVWFTNRPELGFVQFESKHKVEEILSSFGGPEVRINNQLVQLKKGGDCLRLEWQLLTKLDPSALDDEFESISDSEAQKSIFPPDVVSSSSNNAVKQRRNESQEAAKAQSVHSMVDHYNSICQTMEIPEEEYQKGLQFMEDLQTLLAKKFPACKLILFRNWFLKLKNTSPLNELVFFFDEKGMYEAMDDDDVNKNLERFPPVQKDLINHLLLYRWKTLAIRKMTKEMSPALFDDVSRLSFQCQKYDLLFSVVRQSHTILPELQTCRLLSYLCSFDARVKPLLTVIRYWAKVNEIRLSKPGIIPLCRAPDPAGLDWLVIFFLCHKKKILPTSREVTERPHPKIIFKSSGVDIGFAEDADFAQQFYSRYDKPSEKAHVLNIFSLAEEFCNFYGAELLLQERKLVLNIKDGEVIAMEEFVGKISGMQTKLRKSEIKSARNGKEINPPNVIVIHPLYIQHNFAFCDKAFVSYVCPALQITRKKLKRALEKYKNGEKFNMRSALKINLNMLKTS